MTGKKVSLPDNMTNMIGNDDRALPLIVAEMWKFPLRIVYDDNINWYSIRDWIAGITRRKDPKGAWQRARKAAEMKPVLERIRHYPYGNGTSQFIDDKGLYALTLNLRATKNRPALLEIRDYLSAAGAFVDLIRRDPQARAELGATAGPDAVIDAAIVQFQKKGLDDNWIHARLEGIATRKEFTAALKAAVLHASGSLYGKSTERIYGGLWERTTAQLRGELNLQPKDNLRDHFGEYALIYTRLAEKVATDKLRDAETVPEALAMEIIREAAKLMHIQANATSQALGIDLVTENPLLPERT